MDISMNSDAKFWDAIARKYAARPVSDPEAYAHTLARTRNYMRQTDSVLELGCGTGSTALALGDACGAYLGTDVAPEMIAIASEKEQGAGQVSFAVSDSTMSGEADESRDVVLAFNLLHLLPDLDATLMRSAAVLKPGGYFISKTPCLAGQWYLRPVIAVMQVVGKAPFLRFLRPSDLDARIKAAGFEIVELAEHNKSTWGHFIVARKVH